MTETADRIDPWVFVDLFGQTLKVQYKFKSAKIYKRLTGGGSLLDGVNVVDADQLIALIVSGLVVHHPDLVGQIDSLGTPDSTMRALIAKIEDLDLEGEHLPKLLRKFIDALNRSSPQEGADSSKKADPSPESEENSTS